MRLVRIVFSPSGGTDAAAYHLGSSWKGVYCVINLTDRDFDFSEVRIYPDDLVTVAMPSYSGRAPALAVERFRQIRGNGARCTLLAVYGNRAQEDTLIEMFDAASEGGFTVSAAVCAVAQHSIIGSVAAGRPDEADAAKLADMGRLCIEAMAAGRVLTAVPGNRPYKPGPSSVNCPERRRGCTMCGDCAEVCPSGAIDADMVADPAKCISCMRCVSICEQGARRLDEDISSRIEAYLLKTASERREPELFI